MNIQKLMKQAQTMQKQMQDMQEKFATMEFEGTSGGGLVKVTVTGKGDVKKLSIDASLFVPAEKEVTEDLIVAAVNDAKKKSEDAMQGELGKFSGGLGLPPGMLPF